MDCRETCARLEDFFHGRLPADELEPFMEHIRSCGECEEELKSYVAIEVGLEQLDDDSSGVYDPEGTYRDCMESARTRIDWYLAWKSFQYAMTAIAFWFAILALVLQAKAGLF